MCDSTPVSTTALRAALAFMAQTSRARVREGRGADGGGAARARGSCATAPRFNNCVEGKNRQEVPMVKSQEVLIEFLDHYLELGSPPQPLGPRE